MSYSLENVLHHHGVSGTGDTLTDNAREAGIIYACHGCGSVGGIDPMTLAVQDVQPAREATRDLIDWDEFECCEGENMTVF